MSLPRNQVSTTFNGVSPLILVDRHEILVFALKSISNFISETSISLIEHIQEVSNIHNIHGVVEDDVTIRLLASSLKGKALHWYIVLPHNSIKNRDELG